MGYFNDEYTKQKMDLKEGFDFRHVQVSTAPLIDVMCCKLCHWIECLSQLCLAVPTLNHA
jgi:hypothetical protein